MPRVVDRQIEIAGDALRGPLRREMIRRAAQQAFDETRARNLSATGQVLPEKIVTDGVLNKRPEDMVVGGKSELLTGEPGTRVIPFTLALLERVSPRGRSNSKPEEARYAKSHAVFVDGQRIDEPYILPPNWSRLVFTSLSPYHRKIERGLSKQRPNGVYELLVYPEVEKEFGAVFNVDFNYEGGLVAPFGKTSYIQTAVPGADGRLKRRRRKRKITDAARSRLPAIIVERR